jgi:hypothetical protein
MLHMSLKILLPIGHFLAEVDIEIQTFYYVIESLRSGARFVSSL